MNYKIDAIHCDGCARSVKAAVREADPAATVEVDVPARTAQIDSAHQAAVVAALADAGFPAVPA